MYTIYKYELETTGIQEIEMPANAQILSVHVQYEKPCIWAMVDTDRITGKVKIATFVTWHEVTSDGSLSYIGTYQLHGGALVFHVFKITN